MQKQNPPSQSNVNITLPEEKPLRCDCKPVISSANQKGGVGKTTTVINLARAFAEHKYKTFIFDTDPQGNCSKTMLADASTDLMLEVFQGNFPEPLPTYHENIFIIPATRKLTTITDTLTSDFTRLFRLKEYLSKIKFDIALIDTPPTLTGVSIAAQIAATHTIMPISPHFYSLQGANDLMSNFRQIKEHLNKNLVFLGVLITDYDKRTALAGEIVNEIKQTFKEKIFSSIIPRSVAVEEAIVNGKSIIDFAPRSEISKSYFRLADEILFRIQEGCA